MLQAGLLKPINKIELTEHQKALQILNQEPNSNLGWRIILDAGDKKSAQALVSKAASENRQLVEVIPAEQKEAVLSEAKAWALQNPPVDLSEEPDESTQRVAVTTYQGSKGRSAQYVFMVGVHSRELPRNPEHIEDIEICCFLVGLTRTKKKCSILVAKNAMGEYKKPSEFLTWIDPKRFMKKTINAAYWNQQ